MVVQRNTTALPLRQRSQGLAVLYLQLAALPIAGLEQKQLAHAATPDSVVDSVVRS